mmetsp:Transcript_16065/g.40850  ORF Transcript_16065/g.40850 Transcript_16065/m.40850 type:complete len:1046 (+) Transcript_16065:43-3180(+)
MSDGIVESDDEQLAPSPVVAVTGAGVGLDEEPDPDRDPDSPVMVSRSNLSPTARSDDWSDGEEVDAASRMAEQLHHLQQEAQRAKASLESRSLSETSTVRHNLPNLSQTMDEIETYFRQASPSEPSDNSVETALARKLDPPPSNSAPGVDAAYVEALEKQCRRLEDENQELRDAVAAQQDGEEDARELLTRARDKIQSLNQIVSDKDAELRQMRSNYDARVLRCSDLATEAESRMEQVQKLRAHIYHSDRELERTCMQNEDKMHGFVRLLARKRDEIKFLDDRLNMLAAQHERLLTSREPVSESALEVAMLEKDKKMSAMDEHNRAQARVLQQVRNDVRSCLDFMIRTNIEAAGGPSKQLTDDDFLPPAVVEHLELSPEGDGIFHTLLKKYAQFCRNGRPPRAAAPAISDDEDENEQRPTFVVNAMTPSTKEAAATPPPPPAAATEAPVAAAAAEQAPAASKPSEGFFSTMREFILRPRVKPPVRARQPAPVEAPQNNPTAEDESTTGSAPAAESMASVVSAEAGRCRDLSALMEGLEAEQRKWVSESDRRMEAPQDALHTLETSLSAQFGQRAPSSQGSDSPVSGTSAGAGEHVQSRSAMVTEVPVIQVPESELLPFDSVFSTSAVAERLAGLTAEPQIEDLDATACEASHCASDDGGADENGPTVDPEPVPLPKIAQEAASPVPGATRSDPYRVVETTALHAKQDPGLLSSAWAMLEKKSKDLEGVLKNARAKAVLGCSALEQQQEVLSCACCNYTHAGVEAAAATAESHVSPLDEVRRKQVLVLTCERVVLLQADSFDLRLEMPLSNLRYCLIAPFSASVFVLRRTEGPDLLLDTQSREDFFQHLRKCLEFCEDHPRRFGEPVDEWPNTIVPLLGTKRDGGPVAAAAFLQYEVFLFLPWHSNSCLMRGDTFFFGFLYLHEQRAGDAADSPYTRSQAGQWRWSLLFFMLKTSTRELVWVHHPSDTEPAGSIKVDNIQSLHSLDSPTGEFCFILNCTGVNDATEDGHVLRSVDPRNREDWIVSIRSLQSVKRPGKQAVSEAAGS